MKKKLELIVLLNSRKRKEFSQSLDNLSKNLQNYCSSLMIDESGDGVTFNILAQWETEDQMRKALKSEEFLILSGAINALSEKSICRLDDKQVGNHISKLKSL
jgi:hypothetical protein